MPGSAPRSRRPSRSGNPPMNAEARPPGTSVKLTELLPEVRMPSASQSSCTTTPGAPAEIADVGVAFATQSSRGDRRQEDVGCGRHGAEDLRSVDPPVIAHRRGDSGGSGEVLARLADRGRHDQHDRRRADPAPCRALTAGRRRRRGTDAPGWRRRSRACSPRSSRPHPLGQSARRHEEVVRRRTPRPPTPRAPAPTASRCRRGRQ